MIGKLLFTVSPYLDFLRGFNYGNLTIYLSELSNPSGDSESCGLRLLKGTILLLNLALIGLEL